MFSYEIVHYQKILISIFGESLASMDKILILGGKLDTRLSFFAVYSLVIIVSILLRGTFDKIKFEGIWSQLEGRKSFQRQPWTK